MMLILEGIIGAYVFGLFAMLTGMRNSPEGYEDEDGFHLFWQNNTPETRNVACVWVTSGSLR